MKNLTWKKIGMIAAGVLVVVIFDSRLAGLPVVGPLVAGISNAVRKIPVIGPKIPRL